MSDERLQLGIDCCLTRMFHGSSVREYRITHDGVPRKASFYSVATKSSVLNVTVFLPRGHPQSLRSKVFPKRPSVAFW